MTRLLMLLLFITCQTMGLYAQKMTIAQMKAGIEKSANPIAYVRQVLKKKYRLDTVAIMNTTYFSGVADSLAYKGKEKKVYGPVDKKFLVQVLGKVPNTFTRVSQIFIDTSMFTRRIADSLANSIIERINNGSSSFEDMAITYSMGGESISKGDLGWIAKGSILPEIEKEIALHKKGEPFKIWSKTGLHIMKKTGDPKQDAGYALLLRVFL